MSKTFPLFVQCDIASNAFKNHCTFFFNYTLRVDVLPHLGLWILIINGTEVRVIPPNLLQLLRFLDPITFRTCAISIAQKKTKTTYIIRVSFDCIFDSYYLTHFQ